MKEMTYEQLENLQGGKINWSCISQVASGMEVLGTLAAIGILSLSPLGWGLFAFTATSFISGVIANPTACD